MVTFKILHSGPLISLIITIFHKADFTIVDTKRIYFLYHSLLIALVPKRTKMRTLSFLNSSTLFLSIKSQRNGQVWALTLCWFKIHEQDEAKLMRKLQTMLAVLKNSWSERACGRQCFLHELISRSRVSLLRRSIIRRSLLHNLSLLSRCLLRTSAPIWWASSRI